MEQSGDKRLVRLVAVGQELSQILHVLEIGLVAGAIYESPRGIDWFAVILVPITANRIEMFQVEPQRVDDVVAGHAVFGAGLQGDAFTGIQVGMQLWRQRSEGIGGRSQWDAEHVAGEE